MLVVQGKDPPPPPIVAPGDIKEEEVFDFCIKLLLKNLSLFCSHFFGYHIRCADRDIFKHGRIL